jgi:predicted signal transduction protein with EAL and GGDEF domain
MQRTVFLGISGSAVGPSRRLAPGLPIVASIRTGARGRASVALEVKMTLDGHVVDCRASIGVSSCPDHGVNPATLIERVDVAMRAAKHDQIGIAVWDERYDDNGEKRLSLMSDLRAAVDNDELSLIYQPKIMLGESTEHSVEALLCWEHPKRGLVAPSEFVPLAEQTGYIRTCRNGCSRAQSSRSPSGAAAGCP